MPIHSLTKLSTADPETVPLEDIALLVAKDPYPSLTFEPYHKMLERFAYRARFHIKGVVGDPAIARALSDYLFKEEGFHGNIHDYYNPSNNLLNDVLDQRTGMPITLCIVYIAVGRRLGLPLSGVCFPGHFLVHYAGASENFYIDAFSRGKLLSFADCKKRLTDKYQDSIPSRPEFFQPASHRNILLRLMSNLKLSYMLRKDYEAALRMLNFLLLFAPDDIAELKERGLLYFHMECFQSALSDLESYLKKAPKAPDRRIIEACLKDLRSRVAQIS